RDPHAGDRMDRRRPRHRVRHVAVRPRRQGRGVRRVPGSQDRCRHHRPPQEPHRRSRSDRRSRMTELTTYAPTAEVAALDPTGGRLVAWAEAAAAANQLAKALSRTTFVPKDMTDVGNATAAILMGDELGMSPIASLRSIYVVH